MHSLLKTGDLERALQSVPHWIVENSALQRRFVFRNFIDAFGFMTKVALLAERMNHHPDWRNSYRTVFIELRTHDAGGITGKDIELAMAIDRLI